MKVVQLSLGLLFLVLAADAQSLHVKNQEALFPQIQPPANIAHLPVTVLEAPGPRWTTGRSHLILDFEHPVSETIVAELNRRGAFVVGAVPDFGVAISAPDDFNLDGLGVAWAGRLNVRSKISPLLAEGRDLRDVWFVAEFFPDVDMREAARMAGAVGFAAHAHPDLLPNHLLLSGDPARLGALAQWDEVAYMFRASRDLIRGEHVGRCVGAMTTAGITPMYVTSGTGWPKDAAGQVTLSYVFGPLTPKLDSAQATQAILQALQAWTQYAPVKYVPGQSATAPRTVYIFFASGDHGDGFPFDGPGGILAHTFYPAPPNPESIAGDMHFDADENWHIGADTDLFTVALHEAGHTLGLAHVDDPAALMYPYYHLGSKIAADDIAGVQAIYGPPSGVAPAATQPLTLSIATPTTNTTTANAAIASSGTTSGAIGTVQITWQTDHGASGTATGTTQWSIPSAPLVVGSNILTVTAADSSRKVVQTVTVTRSAPTPSPVSTPVSTQDRTPPTITISCPTGSVVNTTASTILVKGTAADNVGVAKVTWQSAWGTGNATGTTAWSVPAIPLLVGSNLITMRAYDGAGNVASQSILVMRK